MKFYISLFLLLLSCPSFSQDSAYEYFEVAGNYWAEEEYENAILTFENYLEYCDDWKPYERRWKGAAFLCIGQIYLEMGAQKLAEAQFLKLLENIPTKKKQRSDWETSIFRAYLHLSQIYLDQEEYKNALKYIQLTKESVPKIYKCGDARHEDEVEIALIYSAIQKGIKE